MLVDLIITFIHVQCTLYNVHCTIYLHIHKYINIVKIIVKIIEIFTKIYIIL